MNDKKKEITQADYNHIAPLYIEDFEHERRHFDFIDHAIQILRKHHITNLPLIDLGSGPGTVTDYLLENKWSTIIAVDFTPGFITHLNQKYKKYPSVQVIEREIEDFAKSTKKNSVAGYIDSFALIHMPDEVLDQVFAKLYQSTVPGGIFVMACWQGTTKGYEVEPYQIQNDKRLNTKQKLEAYMNYFTQEELRNRLSKVGYSMVAIQEFNEVPQPGEFNHPVIWLLATKPTI